MVSGVDRPQRVRDPSGVEFDPKVVQTFAQTELAELPNSYSIKVNESTPHLEFLSLGYTARPTRPAGDSMKLG